MSATSYTDFANASTVKPSKVQASATQVIPGRETEMAANNNGGVSFVLDMWGVLDRFLVLGSETGGYTTTKRDVMKLGFDTVKKCIQADGLRVVARALEYSLAGRAPKNDPAVVAIALAAVYGDELTKVAAFEALPKIARTGTWLFMFVSVLDSLGKWNAAAKRGVAKWYTSKTVDRLAVQLLKYQQRDGWAHRDVLRLAHVKPSSDIQSALFRYSVKGAAGIELGTAMPQLVVDFELLKRTDSKADVLRILEAQPDLSWEMIPTQWLKDKDVLSQLVKTMGLTAVIRKLGALTAHGVIAPLSAGAKDVIAKLSDVEGLRKQRVHPITLLQAFKQYQVGHGEKGSLSWKADQRVLDAINDAFYTSFGTIEKTDESYLMGVDCSGSMQSCPVNGSPNLTAVEVAGVMALACVKNQPNYWIGGFNHRMGELKITPNMRLDAVTKTILAFSWGSTDASLPFKHASQHGMMVDKFVVITDNDINTGGQPVLALRDYRKKTGKAAKSVVIATSMSEFTIADPKDSGMLDIAGFDSAAPQIIAQL
jgi:60 kDa SS-A/Ro ribonucleoprotein